MCNRTCEFCSTFGFIRNVGRSADRSHGQFWDSVFVHGNFWDSVFSYMGIFFQLMLLCGMLTGLQTGLTDSFGTVYSYMGIFLDSVYSYM